MAAFPQYDSKLLTALDAQASAMLDIFESANYARVEPPILQPADVFLDRSGEEIRRRAFTLTDLSGGELCLRPELTIPVCRMHLAGRGKFPARLCYHGPAFRFQPNEPERPSQFLQTGIECLGAATGNAAEIEVLSLVVDAVRAGGLKRFSVKLGDLNLFVGLIDGLDIPSQWRGRLKRHFWRPGYFNELLVRLSGDVPTTTQRYLAHIGAAPEAEQRLALEGLMDYMGGAPLGGRTREEIIDRLMEQAAEAAAVRLDKSAVKLIDRVLSIKGPARQCVRELRGITKSARVKLEAPLVAMDKRIAALTELGFEEKRISFAAQFGRNMEYYTGFVFELWSRDAEGQVQIAGGGRYDTLLKSLGAAKNIPAVGCAIRDERVLAARRATVAHK